MKTLSFALVCGLTIANAPGQAVSAFVTSQAGDRLAAKSAGRFENGAPPGLSFTIDEKKRDQTMTGFGASFLESGMMCLNTLSPAQREVVLRALFDPRTGAGFTAMKTVLGSTDFMAAGPFFTYDDHPGDAAMKLFSIQRDLEPNGLIPFIRAARGYGSFVLEAPMDYPPDWMLVDVNRNQNVDPRHYDALALYYLRYLQAYEKQGIHIDLLSLFNEPGIYTKIGAREIRDLLKDHVGPLFARNNVTNGVMACEPNSRKRASEYWPVILDDPRARGYNAAISYHGYDYKEKDFYRIADLHRRYPQFSIWMTEICHAYEGNNIPYPMKLPNLDYSDGDFWGNLIFSDLEAGTSAWIYWNMILDEKGGPWAVSPVHGNPEDNPQHPVVIVNSRTHQVTYTGLYYYLAHFSRFVRPGSVRIGATGSVPQVRCLAFESKDGSIVAEVMNSRKQAAVAHLLWRGKNLRLELPALSITTYVWPG